MLWIKLCWEGLPEDVLVENKPRKIQTHPSLFVAYFPHLQLFSANEKLMIQLFRAKKRQSESQSQPTRVRGPGNEV